MLSITWATDVVDIDPESGERVGSTEFHILEFDCTTKELHGATASVAEHNVEDGSPIADHKRADPDVISLEVMVTNTPIRVPGGSGFGETNAPSGSFRASPNSDGIVLQFDREFDRVSDVLKVLRRLTKAPVLVTVETSVETYENMTLINVSAPREGMDAIKFSIDLKALRIVETSLVDAPEPREPRGSSASNSGNQEGEDANGNVNQSQLSRLTESVRERMDNGEGFFEAAGGTISDGFGSLFGG